MTAAERELLTELERRIDALRLQLNLPKPTDKPWRDRPVVRLRPCLHDLVLWNWTDILLADAAQAYVTLCGFRVSRGPETMVRDYEVLVHAEKLKGGVA